MMLTPKVTPIRHTGPLAARAARGRLDGAQVTRAERTAPRGHPQTAGTRDAAEARGPSNLAQCR